MWPVSFAFSTSVPEWELGAAVTLFSFVLDGSPALRDDSDFFLSSISDVCDTVLFAGVRKVRAIVVFVYSGCMVVRLMRFCDGLFVDGVVLVLRLSMMNI